MNPFWMVLADLRRTLLASLGILVLLALAFSVSVLVSLTVRALRSAGVQTAQDFNLVVGAAGSRLDLVLAAVYLKTDEALPLLGADTWHRLARDPRVAALSPLLFADHYGRGPIVGVGADFPRLRPSLHLTTGSWPAEPGQVVVGSDTGLALGDGFHGSHGVSEAGAAEDHPGLYTVVGVFAATGTPWDRACLTPVEGIWAEHGLGSDQGSVSALLVQPRDFAAAYGLRADYRQGTTTAAFPGEVLAQLLGLFDQVQQWLGWVGLLFQCLVFAAVLLSLLAGLPSKAQWMGLLRALGAGPWYVVLTLWLQNALVFALAAGLAALLGSLAAQGVAAGVAATTGLVLSPAWGVDETLLLATFAGVGLLGALVPALVAYRTSVRLSLSRR